MTLSYVFSIHFYLFSFLLFSTPIFLIFFYFELQAISFTESRSVVGKNWSKWPFLFVTAVVCHVLVSRVLSWRRPNPSCPTNYDQNHKQQLWQQKTGIELRSVPGPGEISLRSPSARVTIECAASISYDPRAVGGAPDGGPPP